MTWTLYFGEEVVDLISDSELGELMSLAAQVEHFSFDVILDLKKQVAVLV